MTRANKRTLSVLGFVGIVGLCVGVFFVGKHAGSRKVASAAQPVAVTHPSSSSVPPPVKASPSPSASPSSLITSTSPDTSTFTAVLSASAGLASSFGPSTTIPLRISVPLSSTGENPAVLVPTSCTISGGVATASGTFNPDFYGESYVRAGDVVELYVYSAPGRVDPDGTQLADLGSEHPVPVDRTGPWQVTVPMDSELGSAAQCRVAVQSTHAFMGAGDAGG
jgi:hypothetical protein